MVRYSNPAGNPDKPKDMEFDASGNIYIAGSSDNDARDELPSSFDIVLIERFEELAAGDSLFVILRKR